MRSGDFRLLTLGRLALVDPTGVEDASLGTRRRKLALLAVLATARRPVSRDALVELFWGEQSEERARHSLSDALSHLRRTLGPGSITARRAEVALADDAPLAVDVLALAAAADAGRWDEVVALYAGPVLDAVHGAGSPRWEQWVDQQRARVEAAFQSACRAECARLAAAGEWEACAALAARWLERAPLSAPAAVRRLTALAADGSADGARRALDAYERLGRLLRAEYGAAPDATVAAAAREIADRLAAAPEPAPPAPVVIPVVIPVALPAESPTEPEPAAPVPSPAAPAVVARDAAPVRRRRLRYMLGVAAALAAVATGVVLRPRERAAPPAAAALQAARDRVLVADFESAGPDYPVALLVGEAVRIGLSESSALRVMEEPDVRAALVRLERPASSSLAPALARELARQEGIDAVVVGAVRATPGGLVLSAALESAAGEVLVTARAIAADSTGVLAAAESLARQLREGVGESARAIRAAASLAAVTTRSPAALERYTQAQRALHRDGDRERAIALLEEALALDSTFAMAHHRLGVVLNSDPFVRDRMTAALTRAVRHADRLPERERQRTLGSYHMLVTADYARAAAAYRELLALQPDDGAT
ncbi:MAG: BTAD domain-containing putative transcriptional regulator, partial [Gemmatirosa sp.]